MTIPYVPIVHHNATEAAVNVTAVITATNTALNDSQAWENWNRAMANFYQGGTNLAFWIVLFGSFILLIGIVILISSIRQRIREDNRDAEEFYPAARRELIEEPRTCEQCGRVLTSGGRNILSYQIVANHPICNTCIAREGFDRYNLPSIKHNADTIEEHDIINEARAHASLPNGRPVMKKKARILRLE